MTQSNNMISAAPALDCISAVIFDWAGTTIDFGCMAPMAAFVSAFSECGLEISEAEARRPMGSAKRDHVAMILAQPEVDRRWRSLHGRAPDASDIDRIYEAFLRIDAAGAAQYSALIPGALEAERLLRRRGIRIGGATGYPRSIMTPLLQLAERQGFRPDHCVTASDVSRGRPWPDMLLACALALKVDAVWCCVVIDDSPSGLASARAAGMWAVGVAVSGNEVGLPLEVWNALAEPSRQSRRAAAAAVLSDAGAHYVIDSVAALEPIMDAIERRLKAGDRP